VAVEVSVRYSAVCDVTTVVKAVLVMEDCPEFDCAMELDPIALGDRDLKVSRVTI
jgi:hypothetical protein